jgi:Arc/MetJ-type ribon-helix-helix transcriptional regulator
MPAQFPPDVQQSLTALVASGKYASEKDALRDALRALAEEQDDLDAVCQAIEEVDAGDPGMPVRQAFDELRERHGIGRES